MKPLAGRLPGQSLIVLLCLFIWAPGPARARQKPAPENTSTANPTPAPLSDPLLQAMREELERSKAHLRMENVPAPYYIEYRLSDTDTYEAEAAFGALREDQRLRARVVRVVVRVGDYKQDSYGPSTGVVNLAPVDNDPTALRWQLWTATDEAYKVASEALAMKKANLRQYTSDQPYDDFAQATPIESIDPLETLDFDSAPWKEMLEKATALFRTDPKIESLSARLRFRAVNDYFVNSEGTVTRSGYHVYFETLLGSTQADDGMTLDRSPYYTAGSLKDLPTPAQFEADSASLVQSLKALRDAPVVDEDYNGPVLFSADAASDIFNGMVGRGLLGIRPKPGDSARTVGDYASNYKSRVLPTFVSVSDDPGETTFEGKLLIGSYDTDNEGVRAVKVPLVQDGMLVNYLLGRNPIRDFPASNGHGRSGPGLATAPNMGVLTVQSSQPLSPDALKQKLIEICKQQGKPFGYYVETLGGPYEPRMLYRVYANDGHQELVRGAIFDDLDTHALKNELVAAGNDLLISNRDGQVPTTIISPSMLLDDLEVKRTDAKSARLPEYPPPDLTSAR